jgi:hypothetical protein
MTALTTPIAFTARLSSDTTGHTDPTVFDNVITNVGGGYSSSTGKFTAPIAGTYVFLASLTAGGHNTVAGRISMNGVQVSRIYSRQPGSTSTSTYPAASGHVILHLNVGDEVTVKSKYKLNQYSHFTGFLLSPD